jgi:hypothetical protein
MTPVQRLCGLAGLMLALALPAACHRRLPRPGKPIVTQPAHPAPAPQSTPQGTPQSAPPGATPPTAGP